MALLTAEKHTKMIATDALRHSKVRGFNRIIRSDDLEQIQYFKMPFRVVAKRVDNPVICVSARNNILMVLKDLEQ